MQVDNTCFPAQKERPTVQVAIPWWSSSFTTSVINLLALFSYYYQREGIYLALSECVIECLSTGSINLNCVWLYTVCRLAESRSILGHIWSLYYCLKRCSQDRRKRATVCKVRVIQMISLKVLCTAYQQGCNRN